MVLSNYTTYMGFYKMWVRDTKVGTRYLNTTIAFCSTQIPLILTNRHMEMFLAYMTSCNASRGVLINDSDDTTTSMSASI